MLGFRGAASRRRFWDDNLGRRRDRTAVDRAAVRRADGLLPGYMEKTVTSRMAVSNLNLKTLEMNCTDLRENRKLPKKRLNSK